MTILTILRKNIRRMKKHILLFLHGVRGRIRFPFGRGSFQNHADHPAGFCGVIRVCFNLHPAVRHSRASRYAP